MTVKYVEQLYLAFETNWIDNKWVWQRQVKNSANDRQHRRCWRTGVETGGCSTNSQYSTTDCERNAYSSSWLNTSSSTASTLAVVCAVLGLPLPDSLVIDPVCFKR